MKSILKSRKILSKQLDLLARESEVSMKEDLSENTKAMISVYKELVYPFRTLGISLLFATPFVVICYLFVRFVV